MEYQYPRFTPEMKKTHTILMPNMAPIHFEMIVEAMRDEGYKVELLDNSGHDVAQEGLKYVHNDTCYPALLVIGQFINALKSGKYDLDRTALIITQTGGGCRASNYIHLLRKALEKAGCFAVVLEKIPASVAQQVTDLLSVPTIGIGAGSHCDGQVLVYADAMGLTQGFEPKFLREFAAMGEELRRGVRAYCEAVKGDEFPNESESY